MKKPNKFYARVKRGAPTIFTVLSVAGVIATGILSARAANKTRNTEESEKSTVDNFKEGWKNYIPAIAVGGVTIVCSISSNVLNRHQRVALVSAYTLASKSYEDYNSGWIYQLKRWSKKRSPIRSRKKQKGSSNSSSLLFKERKSCLNQI